jgi:hypothetical protein
MSFVRVACVCYMTSTGSRILFLVSQNYKLMLYSFPTEPVFDGSPITCRYGDVNRQSKYTNLIFETRV